MRVQIRNLYVYLMSVSICPERCTVDDDDDEDEVGKVDGLSGLSEVRIVGVSRCQRKL